MSAVRVPGRHASSLSSILVAGAMTGTLFVSGGAPLAAQQPPDSARAVVDSTAVFPLDPLVVTVSKLPVRASRSGFAVDVVPRARLVAERPTYAADALRQLPGAFIDEAVGPDGPTIVRLRGGEEVFTQILMDGVQVNENGGFFDFQGVTLDNIDRIEVARGPQAAVHGSSAVSGVVQFITRPGERGPLRMGGSLEGGGGIGDGRRFHASADARGGSSNVLYSASGGVAYDRGIYEVPSDTWSRDASVRIDASPAARLRLGGVARYIGVMSHQPVRDAGATRVPLDPNAKLERNRFIATTEARFIASTNLTHSLRASVFRQNFFFGDRADGIDQPPDFFVPDFNFDFNADLTRSTLEYIGQLGTSGRETGVRLAFGGQVEREDLTTDQTGDFGDLTVDLDRSSAAAFADLDIAPRSTLSILAGVRAEGYQGVGTQWTPRASLVWAATPRLSLRTAAGRAYKVPNLSEQYTDNDFIAPNPDLKPETSVSVEVGADITSAAGTRLGFTAFRQSFRNLIRSVEIEGDTRTQNRNIGRSRAEGVEASLHVPLGNALDTGFDLTGTRTEILENSGLPADQYPIGEGLPFRPDWTASAFLHARPGRVDILGRATWTGRQTVLSERFSGNRVNLDGYLRVDATLNYTVTRGRTLYLRIENLLDADYSTAYDRMGRPLSAILGFQVGR